MHDNENTYDEAVDDGELLEVNRPGFCRQSSAV